MMLNVLLMWFASSHYPQLEGEAQQLKVDSLVDDLLKQVNTPATEAA